MLLWVVDDAFVWGSHFAVGEVASDSVALGFAFFELSFNEFASRPVAVFAVGLRVAVIAKGNGLCAAEGFGDYVVVMGRWFLALKAFRHCPQCGVVGAFDVMVANRRWCLS